MSKASNFVTIDNISSKDIDLAVAIFLIMDNSVYIQPLLGGGFLILSTS